MAASRGKRAPKATAAAVAQDSTAPAPERFDAQAEATGRVLGQTITPDAAMAIGYIMDRMQAEAEVSKGGGAVIQGPWGNEPKRKGPGPQSVFLDEFKINLQGEYWERPGLLSFDSMRSMVAQTPILHAIIQTRLRQVKSFCRPQTDRSKPGFRIEHVDPTVELSDEHSKSIQLLTKFVSNCGWEEDPRVRKRLQRDNFTTFMAKLTRDDLIMDSAAIETEFKAARKLGIDGFYALDGATIRLCVEDGYRGDDEIFALQVIDGQVRTAYTYDQLTYEVRNPTTDVSACGYGMSETEMLVRVVTYLLNTMTYNGSFFDKNAIPRGIMTMFGNFDQNDLIVFKRQWNQMVKGAQNAHNLPIMIAKDRESGAQFTEVGGQLSEMAFGKWLTFLSSIACAIYGVAPEEISMESYSSDKSSLSGSDTGERIVSANDKGFRTLMSHREDVISDFIIRTISPDFRLVFGGISPEDEKQRFEARKLGQTWNEFRKSEGEEAIKGPLGDMPMNPAFIPTWSAQTGIGQPEPEEEDFGDPSAEGGAGPPGGDPDGDPGDPGDAGDPAGAEAAEGAPGAADGGTDPYGRPMAEASDIAKAFGRELPLIYRFGDD